MIIKGLFELVYTLLNVVLTPFQIIPNAPVIFDTFFERFKNIIFDPIRIVLFFTDAYTVRVIVPLILVVANMEHIYDGIMWVLKKLPFVGME